MFLYLYKPLNYESSLIRNNYIFFKSDVVALAEGLRNKKKKDESAKLSNIEASSSIVIYYCNLTL